MSWYAILLIFRNFGPDLVSNSNPEIPHLHYPKLLSHISHLRNSKLKNERTKLLISSYNAVWLIEIKIYAYAIKKSPESQCAQFLFDFYSYKNKCIQKTKAIFDLASTFINRFLTY